jgi:hypothetical protein
LKNIKNIEYPVLARIGTFEKYQKIEKKLKAAIYIGPKHDKFKITKNFFFPKANFSDSTFLNLYNFFTFPFKIASFLLTLIIIMPVKFKITPKYNKNYNLIVNSQ